MSNSDAAPANIMEYSPRQVSIEIPSKTTGMLVLTDQFYPGWYATVDGMKRPIVSVAGLFRGLRIEPGERWVTMRYTPRTFYIGVWISVVTFVGIITTLILSLKKRRTF